MNINRTIKNLLSTVISIKARDDISAEFFDAGHILGSAGILLKYKEKKIFYSGDFNLDNQSLIKGASFPSNKINLLITETTYGNTDSFCLIIGKMKQKD